jgi:hypothetical protein
MKKHDYYNSGTSCSNFIFLMGKKIAIQ